MNNGLLPLVIVLAVIVGVMIAAAIAAAVFVLRRFRRDQKLVTGYEEKQIAAQVAAEDLFLRKEMLVERQKTLDDDEQRVQVERQQLRNMRLKEEEALAQQSQVLQNLAQLTKNEAEKLVMSQARQAMSTELEFEIKHHKEDLEANLAEIGANMLLESMEKMSERFVADRTSFSLKIPNDAFKGKIIGKEGRNKKAFEQVTGADLTIDEDNSVSVSTFHPIRREIAARVLKALIADGRIQPSKIESVYTQIKDSFENEIPKIGKETLNRLKIFDLPVGINRYVGLLNFRSSYGQNALNHSIEAALIAEAIAKELKVDAYKAKKCAFLHDIGKAIDYEETSRDHVREGIKIANELNLDKDIMESIAKHHETTVISSKFLFITKIADTISASRPGARAEPVEDYIKRMTAIEKICNSIDGVKGSYAMQSGREIRVMVEPIKVSDENADEIALRIKNQIRAVNKIPGKITITVIREYRKQEFING
ncbi:unnamed protein product [Didymodactylos carnosus]|uniref:HD domain-containing protein n=1 Tax=Didymodactylos carnosus TaxID=1234261 RepID=A0A8S2CZT5_9BILA|nr:unnamed protein product [Didymodactylos carnosus]CAF3588682.1 unnamed protein product [Didymodactylos carnosus]